jgi:heme-degrading monooxygenase HmoA
MAERPYSQTEWRVKPGREADFVERWRELAEWSALQGLAGAKLFLDRDDPTRFVSFGPWESLDKVQRWRSLPGYDERIARLVEVLERFDPHTLEQIAEQ